MSEQVSKSQPAQSDSTPDPSPASPKKAYQTPRLVCYGDIKSLTQIVGNMNNADGGSSNMSKSGL